MQLRGRKRAPGYNGGNADQESVIGDTFFLMLSFYFSKIKKLHDKSVCIHILV